MDRTDIEPNVENVEGEGLPGGPGGAGVVEATSLVLNFPTTLPAPTIRVSGRELPFQPDDTQVASCYWAVVLDRGTLNPIFNRAFVYDPQRYRSPAEYFDTIHDSLAPFVAVTDVLIVATSQLWVGLVPQGPLYQLLVDCGAGPKLDEMEKWAQKQDSTNHGRIAYCLIGKMGGGRTSVSEALASAGQGQTAPLSCNLSRDFHFAVAETGEPA
jgi:hypothetical protein